MPSLAELERRLADARVRCPGTVEELSALVELASRLVRDPQRRGRLADEGLALATRLRDDRARLRCQAMLGEYVARTDQPSQALPGALDTLAEAERLRDPQARAQAHHLVGYCFNLLDCTSEALEHVRAALADYQRAGDRFGEGRMLSLMASLLCQLGEDERGGEQFARAHDIFVECDDPSGAGVMLSNLAAIERESGDPVAAAVTCERALAQFELAGWTLDAQMAMVEYAAILADLDRHDEAGQWVERAAARNRLPDGTPANPSYEFDILLARAKRARQGAGDLAAACAHLRGAVALADELGALRLLADAEEQLADVLAEAGEPAEAYRHLKRSVEITAEVVRTAQDQRVRALRVRFEVEQAQREALRCREQARQQAEMIAELERAKAEVVQLSRTDPLTGIANRRCMAERLAELAALTTRYGTPLAAAVFDVDRFKDVNDRFGHAVGDAVLIALAGLVRDHTRASDLAARLGGDEFVIVMPNVTGDDAMAACRRLRTAVRAHPWPDLAPGLDVTITIGVADATGEADPDAVLRRADAALYRGKRTGRDTVTT